MQFFGFHKDESKENLLYLEKFNKTLKEKETSLIKQLQPIVKIERIDESSHAEPVRSPSPEKKWNKESNRSTANSTADNSIKSRGRQTEASA